MIKNIQPRPLDDFQSLNIWVKLDMVWGQHQQLCSQFMQDLHFQVSKRQEMHGIFWVLTIIRLWDMLPGSVSNGSGAKHSASCEQKKGPAALQLNADIFFQKFQVTNSSLWKNI